jgi:TRAP-type C4-dicarboxylate transport system substrate-binding protein
MSYPIGKFLLATVLAAASAQAVSAQEKIKLRVGDIYPVGHYMAEALAKTWMKEVQARLPGRVEFEYFPAGQLGKGQDFLALTQNGVVDVGLVVPALVPDRLPLSAVAELPGSFSQGCQGTHAYWSLAKGGIINEQELKPNKVRLLLALVLPPYQIFTNSPIKDSASFQGKKIYATGGAKDLTVRAFGGVPMRMSTNEIYESLSRGTIDGGLMGYGTALAYKAEEFAKYATKNENFGAGIVTYAISVNKWNSLPEDVRTVLDEAGAEATMKACATIDAGVTKDMEKLEAAGVTLVAMPEADRKAVDENLAKISGEWAKELDARGRKGSEVLKAFQGQLANQKK